ncbi:MAG TPA: hypothetical protein PLD62_00580 [Candidatus Cloacimonadota bacterium]|nr:hypothetical protein [Candidatus Cloacimonadota bacterium]
MNKNETGFLKKQLPWYTITILLTILGAISIVMLFGVRFYNEHGIVFWSIIVSWVTILLGATLEISRQERLRYTTSLEQNKKIKALQEEIDQLKSLK